MISPHCPELPISKEDQFAAWYETMLEDGEVVDKRYPVKGMPVWRPYGWFLHSSIMELIEKQWTLQGIEKVQFPLCIPEFYLRQEESHIEGFKAECFWTTKGGDKDLDVPLALRPTSETAMYNMFSLWVRSFRDLPLKVHQTCSVYRHETKNTRPLIRVREIPWNEAHTCHATKEDALENLRMAWVGYKRVIEETLGFTGLILTRPDWDRFGGGECSEVMDTIMPCGRVLQTVGAHYLGQKFAKACDIKYLDEKNEFQHVWMTCYGVSTRLLAATLAVHGDDTGFILPPAIARYQVVVVPIIMKKKDSEVVFARCEEIMKDLQEASIRATLD
ncbi:Prolyl-tRNA synthetase, partial [Aduncisulcus paluster]